MTKLTPEQEAALAAMQARRQGKAAATLTPEDLARIRAEEDYRAQVRAASRRNGCAKWGCGLLAIPVVIIMALLFLGSLADTFSADNSPADRKVDFVVNCERQVKAALKAPASAEVSNAFSDGVLTTVNGYAWSGYVDAQNSFGANIRTTFRCSGPPDSPAVTFN